MKPRAAFALALALASLASPVQGGSDFPPPTRNLTLIGAPVAWAQGITGQGVVVALLDTGVDMSQAGLAQRWRGGAGGWLDPYHQHPDGPVDLNGHGTQVLGVILGGGESGQSIGVAPGAHWIAARIFDDRGRVTTAAIHQALRWLLDPDGNPATHDAPQVVNNSWSSSAKLCDREFSDDLKALRAANIVPVFAAGTDRPVSPADDPLALAVGALRADGNGRFADSASGPAGCPDARLPYPSLAAPGENIYTTDRNGLYTTASGSSLAAAHVSGALALLLSTGPGLSADEQTRLLETSAADLGPAGPDTDTGFGRLDIAAALAAAKPPPPLLEFVLFGCGLLAVLGAGLFWRRRRPRDGRPNR